MATRMYDVTLMRKNRVLEKTSVHLDVEGDHAALRSILRQLVLDGVDRQGWSAKSAHEFTLTVRRPGWAHDAFPPYVIPREEL